MILTLGPFIEIPAVPPPPYYQPLPQMHQPSTIIVTPVTLSPMVGSSPSRLRCPNCSAEVISSTHYKTGCLTWSISAAICAAGYVIQ